MKKRVVKMFQEVSKALEKTPDLIHIGNPVLRKKTKDVSFKTGLLTGKKLINILEKYNSFSGVGAGLAAPQIGLSEKVFVIAGKDGYEIYINPEIINYSKKSNYLRESCLSSRVMWGDVKRSETIKIKWIDKHGKEKMKKFSGFKARLLQHEYDHMLGILCLDKAISSTIEYSGNVKGEKLRSKPISN